MSMRVPFPASILYSSARDGAVLDRVGTFDCDVHLLDLEDSVPPSLKGKARCGLARWLRTAPDLARVAVRINAVETSAGLEDLVALGRVPLPGFVFLTMVRSAREPELVRRVLGERSRRTFVYTTLETTSAVEQLPAIANASDGMILGSADLAAELGIPISWSGMLHARQRMAHACGAAGIPAIDTGNFRLGEPGTLERECVAARELGFVGKGTVHPRELEIINRAFRPDPERVRQAERIIRAHDAAGGGVTLVDGEIIGPPFVRQASILLERALAWQQTFGRAT